MTSHVFSFQTSFLQNGVNGDGFGKTANKKDPSWNRTSLATCLWTTHFQRASTLLPFTQAIRLHLPYCRKAADFRTAAQKGTSALDRLQHSFSRGMPLCCRNHSRTFFVTAFCILLYTVFKKKSSLFLKFYNLYDRINLQLADKRRILQKRGRLFHGSFCRVFGTKAVSYTHLTLPTTSRV